MEKGPVAILGGGNGGHAVAANLALAGIKVNLFELLGLPNPLKRSFGQRRSGSTGYP